MSADVSDRALPPVPTLGDEGPSAESVAVVHDLVHDATRALFACYGVPLELDASPASKLLESVQLLCAIGFSSQAFSGSLLLASPNSVVEHTLPTPCSNLADWSRELSNQLLGRVKNQLLDYQIAINISLPVVIACGRFSLPARARAQALTRDFSFVSEWGSLFVRLEAELGPGFMLERRAPTKQSMSEGESLIF